jgi:hypothetical protein
MFAQRTLTARKTGIASQCVILEAPREIELAFFSTDTDFALQK